MRKALLCLVLALASTAYAETVTGRVVSVADGDTITMLDRQLIGFGQVTPHELGLTRRQAIDEVNIASQSVKFGDQRRYA